MLAARIAGILLSMLVAGCAATRDAPRNLPAPTAPLAVEPSLTTEEGVAAPVIVVAPPAAAAVKAVVATEPQTAPARHADPVKAPTPPAKIAVAAVSAPPPPRQDAP